MGHTVRKLSSTQACVSQYFTENVTSTVGDFCQPSWDDFLCWPPTSNGTTVHLHCPLFARGVDTSKKASRTCENGSWGSIAVNYTPCLSDGFLKLLQILNNRNDSVVILSTAAGTRILEIIGLSISMISLIISLFIFCHFRNLKNKRTKIHKNLFIALFIQVTIRITVYIDQYISRRDGLHFTQYSGIDNTAYLCESFYILLEYAKTAMFLWMFIEGYYLHCLITVSVFQEGHRPSFYYGIGWGSPLCLTLIWAMATWEKFHGIVCWWGYNFDPYFWILEGPRFTVIVLNLIFLLNIIRVLVTKLRESNTTEAQQVRKAVRAAIVLLPLLGITNALQFGSSLDKGPIHFAIWSYVTAFLTSFQGFFCGLIYCFLNGEVQVSIQRCWRSRQPRGDGRRQSRINTPMNLIQPKMDGREMSERNNPRSMINGTGGNEITIETRKIENQGDPFIEHWNVEEFDSRQSDCFSIKIPQEYLQRGIVV